MKFQQITSSIVILVLVAFATTEADQLDDLIAKSVKASSDALEAAGLATDATIGATASNVIATAAAAVANARAVTADSAAVAATAAQQLAYSKSIYATIVILQTRESLLSPPHS